MLEDSDEEGSLPLLASMALPGNLLNSSKTFADDVQESCFYKALEVFRERTLFANVTNDIQVPYSTAAIMPRNPYLKEW